MKRDVITYQSDTPITKWIEDHNEKIHTNVLECCESYLSVDTIDFPMHVIRVKTQQGIITFSISNLTAAIESLEKSMNYFVEVEFYELAARTRDCVTAFKNKFT